MPHRGEEAGFLKELAESGLDRQGYRDRRLGTLEQEVIAKRILSMRPPSEQERKERWNREFGPQGVRTHVRIAFFDKLKLLKPGVEVDRATAERSGQDAKVAAEAFHRTVAADRSQFAQRVRTASDHCAVPRYDGIPVDLRSRGGELPRLRPDHFGGQLVQPLANARAGDLLGPIETPQGFFVVELIARGPAPFEAVQDELAEIWRTREPSQGEVHWLKEELRKAATIARFPLNPSGRQ
jgi:hypothetical protein